MGLGVRRTTEPRRLRVLEDVDVICLDEALEVGSKEWCEDMKQKDKGQWTANEAMDFAKHCVLSK